MQQQYGGGIVFLERRHEVWHENDQGDWGIAAFDIDIPDRVLLKLERNEALSVFEREDMSRRVDDAFKQCIKDWLSMRGREGYVPTTKPILRPGFYLIPDDPSALGKRRMYVAARWKREVPELMNVDDAARFAGVGHVDQEKQLDEFFDQMRGLSRAPVSQIERHMKANAEAPEKAKEDAAKVAESDYKETHRISGVRYNRTR